MESQVIQVGKKYTIYLPKKIVEELGIREGDKLMLKIEGEEIILRKVHSKPKIAKVWSKVKIEEVEKVGEELTKQIIE